MSNCSITAGHVRPAAAILLLELEFWDGQVRSVFPLMSNQTKDVAIMWALNPFLKPLSDHLTAW